MCWSSCGRARRRCSIREHARRGRLPPPGRARRASATVGAQRRAYEGRAALKLILTSISTRAEARLILGRGRGARAPLDAAAGSLNSCCSMMSRKSHVLRSSSPVLTSRGQTRPRAKTSPRRHRTRRASRNTFWDVFFELTNLFKTKLPDPRRFGRLFSSSICISRGVFGENSYGGSTIGTYRACAHSQPAAWQGAQQARWPSL